MWSREPSGIPSPFPGPGHGVLSLVIVTAFLSSSPLTQASCSGDNDPRCSRTRHHPSHGVNITVPRILPTRPVSRKIPSAPPSRAPLGIPPSASFPSPSLVVWGPPGQVCRLLPPTLPLCVRSPILQAGTSRPREEAPRSCELLHGPSVSLFLFLSVRAWAVLALDSPPRFFPLLCVGLQELSSPTRD